MSSLLYFDEVAQAYENKAFVHVEAGSQARYLPWDAATTVLVPSLSIHFFGCFFFFSPGAVVTQ